MKVKRTPLTTSFEPLRRHLAAGGVLAIPTESSYGLAVDPRNPVGVEAVYRLKERERGKPLPVVAANIDQLAGLGIDVGSPQLEIVAGFWPAPLTLVTPAQGPDGPWPASGGHATLAVRIPAHRGLLALLEGIQSPLTATSANPAGQAPILDPDALEGWLAEGPGLLEQSGLLDQPGLLEQPVWILDGGVLPGGPPSTLVAWTDEGWKVIREGRFPIADLESPAGVPVSSKTLSDPEQVEIAGRDSSLKRR